MRSKIIACSTVSEELKEIVPADMACTFLEFGLHNHPEKLHEVLQQEIDRTPACFDTILFGFGMCAKGTTGLESRRFRLVIPKTDDCIGILLGSRAEYLRQHNAIPGTFYLTRGWIRYGEDPLTEYRKLIGKYGERKARYIEKKFIGHYTRIALINTGGENLEQDRAYARMQAEFFGLAFEELPGSVFLLEKMISGNWDENFVVVEPGEKSRHDMFFQND